MDAAATSLSSTANIKEQSMNTSATRVLIVTATVAVASLGSIGVAEAKSPRVVERQMCGSIETKLKVSSEDSGAQIEYELDQNQNGKSWKLRLTQDGKAAASATRVTRGPSGSLHWRVLTSGASTGTFAVTATRGSTTCKINATL
jgi:hypothetical protein